jgi:hypothetical protein
MAVEPSAAYFDESRVDGSFPFPVVAGFWSPLDVWMMFEKKWAESFGDTDKKYSRTRDHQKDTEAQRYEDSIVMAKFIRDFTFLPVYATVDKKAFQPLIDKFLSSKNAAPMFSSMYTICSYTCCVLLDEWAESRFLERKQWTPIKVVFDDGNENKIYLERGYKRYYAETPNTHLSKVPLFEDADLSPLRAADLYAWSLSRFFNTGEETEVLKILRSVPTAKLILSEEIANSTLKMIEAGGPAQVIE